MNWHELVELLPPDLIGDHKNLNVIQLAGGDINQSFLLEADKQQVFAKLNRVERLPMFEAESTGLQALAATASIRVPRVYATGCISDHSFIAMEYIELKRELDFRQFGEALAALHAHCQPRFGFQCDNTIGSSPQPNAWEYQWIDFWRERRLGFQLQLARKNGLDKQLIDSGLRVCESLDQFFLHYQPVASLLHGDLWGGNYGADASGKTVIYDPACYYGDHEADLAMVELFSRPAPVFFDSYHHNFAIDEGYSLRKDLYNLYHLINHANLFGGSYVGQALALTQKLLASI